MADVHGRTLERYDTKSATHTAASLGRDVANTARQTPPPAHRSWVCRVCWVCSVTFRRDVGCGITGMQRDTGNAAHNSYRNRPAQPPRICNLGETGPPLAQLPWVPCSRMGRMGRMLMGKSILLTWLRQLGRSPLTTHLSALNLSVSHCVHIISLPSRLSASLACPCCLASRCSLTLFTRPVLSSLQKISQNIIRPTSREHPSDATTPVT